MLNSLNSHLNLLEDFNPNRTNDPFRWIPKGLFYDLTDNENETKPAGPVDDFISGYTHQDFF